MKNRWNLANSTKYNLGYYLVWCTKYRRNVLQDEIKSSLEKMLHVKAKDINVKIEKINIQPDYIYLFVKAPPVYAPHFIVQQFKGYTSRLLRSSFKTLKSRLPTLWTRSYYAKSFGQVSSTSIEKFLEAQKGK